MSAAVKAAMLATHDLRPTERLVVLAIAAHTNSAGNAWPAVSTIAEYVGCSERTVQRCLAKLVQAGRLAITKVAHIATRVYRIIITGVTSGAQGVTDSPAGVPDPAPGGDNPSGGVSPEVEDQSKMKPRGARDWRRFIPKSKNPNTQRQSYPERRGAALPAPRGEQCSRHRGSPAGNCGPCRSEALGGVR